MNMSLETPRFERTMSAIFNDSSPSSLSELLICATADSMDIGSLAVSDWAIFLTAERVITEAMNADEVSELEERLDLVGFLCFF
jgi:hypothetical protein